MNRVRYYIFLIGINFKSYVACLFVFFCGRPL